MYIYVNQIYKKEMLKLQKGDDVEKKKAILVFFKWHVLTKDYGIKRRY